MGLRQEDRQRLAVAAPSAHAMWRNTDNPFADEEQFDARREATEDAASEEDRAAIGKPTNPSAWETERSIRTKTIRSVRNQAEQAI